MSQLEVSTPPAKRAAAHWSVQLLALVAVGVLGAFVFKNGRSLYHEWRSLQVEEAQIKRTAVIGYVNINPKHDHARHPATWFRQEPDALMLWAGWRDGQHEWFKLGRDDLKEDQITGPEGRDVHRAIDYPVVEFLGDERWRRIPDDEAVVGIEFKGASAVYPITVLERVRIVNDEIDGTAFVVTFRPFVGVNDATTAYEAMRDGQRVTMGASGYYLAGPPNKPLMYDRGTRSLWVEGETTLKAVAGTLKGAELKRISPLPASPWSEWRARHPKSRLIVGADRTKAFPER